ncbi:MAG: SDR family NAD(P)-dependent oxidoreductase, partial [Candidatus Puniceispirillaceae bacterium]
MLDFGLQGKTAIVCASSKGLGLGCARALSQVGVNLVMCARGEEQLVASADQIRKDTGVEVKTVACDITSEAGRAEVLAAAGHVDILVNNAGVGHGIDGLDNLPLHLIQEAVDINVTTPIKLTAAVMEEMRAQGKGHIVNIGSIAGLHTLYSALYGATKSAVHLFSQNLRAELSGTPIRVT